MSTSEVAELLAALGGGLHELGVRWYLFGAQAVLVYGRPRLTEDVDVTVELGDHDTKALVSKLGPQGFVLPAFADDLIVTKILGARPKDLEDVRGILAEQRDLDLESIRALLSEIEVALGQSDLISTLEALLEG